MSLGLIILAAGEGKRMFSNTPKVLHKLAGIPMIIRVVGTALNVSIAEQIIVIAGSHIETIKQACDLSFGSKDQLNNRYNKLSWACQQLPLGTADAVMTGLEYIRSDIEQILVLSGDLPLITVNTLNKLIAAVSINDIGLVTSKIENPAGFGRIIRDEQGTFLSIIEQAEANLAQTKINEINVGVYLFPKTFLVENLPKLNNHNSQKEYYLTDLFSIAKTKLLSIKTINPENHLESFSVNTNKQLIDLERSYQLQQAYYWLAQGVKLMDPARLDIRGEVAIGKDVEIDINVILEGKVNIASGVKIGSNCYIKDSNIGSQAVIESNTMIVGATIEEYAKIGPFARIRPDTVIKSAAKVGNFVEIKASTIGNYSKVNHISYIGNATVGKNVNIGAGTITCNYDGYNKHETLIKDNVSIGASCQLIAPITIGEHAVIAAGTTLIKNAPSYQLTLNKKFQYSIQPKTTTTVMQPQNLSTETLEKQ